MIGYKIKDLENLSGIKAHTIRIWEKRYDILKPQRTDTQIRNYDDEELVLLLNISILNKHGIKISTISKLSKDEIFNRVKTIEKIETVPCFDENLLLALIDLNEDLFQESISQLIQSEGLESTFINHLYPFLEKIGIMWLVGSINPAQEHFISNLIRQKLIVEIDKLACTNSSECVLLYLPEHETHELSLLFYHYVLKNRNVKTIYLGQMLPFDSLIQSIAKLKPKALISSWIINSNENECITYFNDLRSKTDIPIFVGGSFIQQLHDKLPENIILIDSISKLEVINTI